MFTLGVFDGVHLGHQAVVCAAADWARSLGGRAVVLTFDPHPVSVIRGVAVSLLCTLERRLDLLGALGALVVTLPFDRALAALPAGDFLSAVRERAPGIRGLVLGHDGHFGHDREGDAALAAGLGSRLGFEVRTVPALPIGGQPVSSRRIRAALEGGDAGEARLCLGRLWTLEGRVAKGDGRGRTLGFPTANLETGSLLLPKRGVYAGRAVLDGRAVPAAVNIGVRPTLGPAGTPMAEVHLVGWSGDLYGKPLSVDLLERLRDEEAFPSLDALKARIAADVAESIRIAGS